MILEAIQDGFQMIGITDHSFVAVDADSCLAYEHYEEYQQELRSLKEKYADKIEVLCGIEQDYYSDHPAEGFDYVIGSVHFIKMDDELIGIDWSGEYGVSVIRDAADRFFDGDVYGMIEAYYETISNVVEITNCDIIGHFDVIRKNNDEIPFFDPQNERYIAAWKKAADRLLEKDIIFEINVSPLLNKTLSVPHPAPDIQDYLKARGAKLLYTGDCHSVNRLRDFAEYLQNKKNALK